MALNIYQKGLSPILFRELVLQCPDAMFDRPDHAAVKARLVAMRELRQQTLMKQAGMDGPSVVMERRRLADECADINRLLELAP